MFDLGAVEVLATVMGVNIALSGDNAIVIGALAAGLPASQRLKAIVCGILIAAIPRVLFSLLAFHLLQVVGLRLVGGLVLAWIAWGMWRDARSEGGRGAEAAPGAAHARTFTGVVTAILVADVSMSLDNILAIAAAARDHFNLMVIGLIVSILLMGFAASLIAKLMGRYPWIIYVGAFLVSYIAVDMTWSGAVEVAQSL